MGLSEAEFLTELAMRAKAYGWRGDYNEIDAFVRHQFDLAGYPVPDLSPNDVWPFVDSEGEQHAAGT